MNLVEQETLRIAKIYIQHLMQQLTNELGSTINIERLKAQKFRYANKQTVDVGFVSRIEQLEIKYKDTELMYRYLKTIYNILATCSFTYIKLCDTGIQVEGVESGKGVFKVSIKQLDGGKNLELLVKTTVAKQE